jgi:hypothetical protein
MKNRIIAVLFIACMTASLFGLLVGCTGGGGGAAEEPSTDIVEIQTFNQDSNGINITNYQVVFKQTADEWNALTDADRDKLAVAGFDAALAKIKEDSVSNYNIIGQTSPGKDDAGNATATQLAFIYDSEAITVQVFGTDQQKTGEVAVDPSQG